MSKSYFTTGKELAERLRWIADHIAGVGDIYKTYLSVDIQATSHVEAELGSPERLATIDNLAGALGFTTKDVTYEDGTMHRTAGVHGLTVYGKIPRPTEDRRAYLLAELAKLPPAPELVAAAALTPDSPELPDGPHAIADEPKAPFAEVEVVEQAPGSGITLVQVDDSQTWVSHGIGGVAPTWLAGVPVGKRVLVRASFDPTSADWTLTDWVEPADDWCSPRWGNDRTEWEIGDDTCALQQWGNETPADAVARHNKWLHSVLDRPATPLVPAADTISAERVEDKRGIHPDRLAKILARLNALGLPGGATHALIKVLPEFLYATANDLYGSITEFKVGPGDDDMGEARWNTIGYDGNAWSVTR